MDTLIPVVQNIQDIIHQIQKDTQVHFEVDFPCIAVVGAQSVGKSSVLQFLVGKDFLPRGAGMMTRCPLVLHLKTTCVTSRENSVSMPQTTISTDEAVPSSSSLVSRLEVAPRCISDETITEYGCFGHLPNKTFFDFKKIREEILKQTERLLENGKSVTSEPIHLKIHSPYVINLTLVDLPGVTKIPLENQPVDIEAQIRGVIMEYIKQPNCIILAVSAANTDLANSDALNIAREVDPLGERTIGVITKCDLVDTETDAVNILLGQLYPLKHGYVGVMCRSSSSNGHEEDISTALETEKCFFSSHPAYSSIKEQCGGRYLSCLLSKTLLSYIKRMLPELKHHVTNLIQKQQLKEAEYGPTINERDISNGTILLHYLTQFSRQFQVQGSFSQGALLYCLRLQNIIDGGFAGSNTSSELLTGGARLHYIFHDCLEKCLDGFDPLMELSDNEIRTVIRNATGPKAALFIPEAAFEMLVRKQITKLKEPAFQCVDQVYQELQHILINCEVETLKRFRTLREHILQVAQTEMQSCLESTMQMVANLIHMEYAYINIRHPSFLQTAEHKAELDKMIRVLPWFPLSSSTSLNSKTPLNATQCYAPPCSSQTSIKQRQSTQETLHGFRSAVTNIWCGTFRFLHSYRTTLLSVPHYSTFLYPSLPLRSIHKDATFFNSTFKTCSTAPPPPQTYNSHTLLSEQAHAFSYTNSNLQQLNLPKSLCVSHFSHTPLCLAACSMHMEEDRMELKVIKRFITSYLSIVRKNIADYIPKAIMLFMVNAIKDSLHGKLVSKLYNPELFQIFLHEDDDVHGARSQCQLELKRLGNVLEQLNSIYDV